MEEKIKYLDNLISSYNSLNFDEFVKKSNEVKNSYLELSETLINSTEDKAVLQSAFHFAIMSYYINPTKYTEDKILKLAEKLAKNGIETINQLLYLFPDNLQIQINGAVFFLKQNKLFEALNLYVCAFKNSKEKRLKAYLAYQISNILKTMNLKFFAYHFLCISNELNPNQPDILNFLGILNIENKSIKKAVKHLDKAISYEKDDEKKSTYIMNKALAISYLRDFKTSQELYLQALGLDSHNHYALQNKLLDLTYIPEISMNDIYKEHLKINKMFNIFNKTMPLEKVERIGIIGADLQKNGHPVSFFSEVFNHSKFYIYHNEYINQDNYPNANVKIIRNISDDDVRKMIKADKIDVLIDLSTHTNKNRLSVFTERCAPIQIQYLAYPVFSGLETFDYYITDNEVETETTKKLYGDKILATKNCFLCYSNKNKDTKFEYIRSNKIRIGIFNRITKLSDPFMNVLKQISENYDNIIFVFKNSELKNKDNKIYIEKYIPEEKIKYLDWYRNPNEGLQAFNEVDVCIDSFPYSGTTTTCDSLSTGTPVVSLSSDTKNFQNVSKSILIHSDLSDFVAYSEDELVSKVYQVGKEISEGKLLKENIQSQFYKNICDVSEFRNGFFEMLENLV